MKLINKLTMVLSKVLEVVHWIGAVSITIVLLLSIFNADFMSVMFTEGAQELGRTLTVYGLEATVVNSAGEINMIAVILLFVASIIVFCLMAMIFRNINLIMKTINGKNKHTTSTSPFQECVIRMVKEIGIFSIAIPVVGFIISTIIFAVSIISGIDGTELSLNLSSFILGLISLCLTNVFSYGANLEKDVDGLL